MLLNEIKNWKECLSTEDEFLLLQNGSSDNIQTFKVIISLIIDQGG